MKPSGRAVLARAVLARVVLGALAFAGSAVPAASSYSEEALKAAYLFRLAGYISWPQQSPADSPFVIAVMDSPGVARELRDLVPGHPINDRIVEVREVRRVTEIGEPQILYVGAGRAAAVRDSLAMRTSRSMLWVTDEEGGLDTGSTLNFVMVDRHVRFEVSLRAAERAGLKISSELLGVAVRVRGSGRQSQTGSTSGFRGLPAPGADS